MQGLFIFLGTESKRKRPVASYGNGTIVVSKRFTMAKRLQNMREQSRQLVAGKIRPSASSCPPLM